MSDANCPYCDAGVPDKANYCPMCARPLRCKDCGYPLVLNANACMACGKLVRVPGTEDGAINFGVVHVPDGYNRLRVHSTPDVHDVDLLASDAAIERVSELVPQLIGNQFERRMHTHGGITEQAGARPMVEEPQEAIPAHGIMAQPQLPPAQPQISPEFGALVDGTNKGIWRIFSNQEGRLIQDSTRLKATSKKDYTIRLVVLYLYARLELGDDKVSRSDVYVMLGEAKVKDGNTATHLKEDSDIRPIDGDYLRLTADGRIRAQQYIADALNPDLPDVYPTGSDGHTKVGRARKVADKGTETSHELDEIAKWVESTRALQREIDHAAFSDAKWGTKEKALLGLYGIRQACGSDREVSSGQISVYLNRAFELPAVADHIRKALDRVVADNKNNLVIHGAGGVYRITQSGVKVVQALLASGKAPDAPTTMAFPQFDEEQG